ncbi:SMI1/KNR4 family protein [Niabella aurantiaca]|uniref:SMI1/KNR4 family protein n=1 Tax=Niabella aurantiaca TaxID=379900 RepID=UPI0003606A90|nr:SMI1/KNR4 family protein [Niabella aurantiaca]
MVTIETIQQKIQEISNSGKFSFTFNKTISTDALKLFEEKNNVLLPDDYKSFLTNIGNGGPGPNYGILSFDESLIDFKLDSKPRIDIQRPFAYHQKWNADWISRFDWDDDRPELTIVNEYMDVGHISGCLQISHYGHGCTNLLVVNGACSGQVWFDARADYGGIEPEQDPNGNTYSFFTWYDAWLSSL